MTNPNLVDGALSGVPSPRTPRTSARRPAAAPQRAKSPAAPLDRVLRYADKTDASDLHLAADSAPLARVDGALQRVPGSSVWSAATVEAVARSLATDGQWATYEADCEANFAMTRRGMRFRVNLYRQRGTVGAALRRIPSAVKTLPELGLSERLGELADLPRGLVLVTGPTGSGKSSTLAALVDRVNRTRSAHIITIEDPIEYLHEPKRALVNQREIGADTADYTTALRQVLRQDPDVILLGELRDLETISAALTAAETGHLVMATLHTQSAAQTVDRIVDVFPSHQQAQVRAQLAMTLKGVISQTLVRRATGPGRVVAAEVMLGTSAIANLIREGKSHQIPSAMMSARTLGMQTMDQALAQLVTEGIVRRDEAAATAQDPGNFLRGGVSAPWAADFEGWSAELSRSA
jgi:twitching motility protein PilT